MKFRNFPRIIIAATLLLCVFHVNTASAQEAQDGFINYAYASWIGTGYYRIEDRAVWILRMPIRSFTLREPEGKKWGLNLLFPLTFGLDQFKDIDVDVGSFTFVPGVEFSYAVFDSWKLKPYGQIGVGKDFKGGSWDTIWGYGITSLASFPLTYGELELGNSLRVADHAQAAEGDNGFSMWEIGLNYKYPVGLNLFNRQNQLSLFSIYKGFMNELEFVSVLDDSTRISQLWTFGIVLGVEPSVKILGIPFRGGGITYTFGDGFTGIGLTTGFPF